MLVSRGGPGGPGLLPGGPSGFHGRPGPGDQGAGASAGGPVSGPVNFFKSGTNKWAANKQQVYGGGGGGSGGGGKGPHFGAGGPLESRLGDGSDSGQGNFYQRKAAAAAAARAAAAAAQHRHHHQQAEVNAPEGSEHSTTESSSTSASASASTSTSASLTTTITPVGAPASSGAPPPPPPPLKIISPLERAIKMKELTSASQALSDALANQKKLMGKMEAAKTAKEKGAILKLLQLTLKNVTAMKQRVEKLQTELTPAFRNSKTFNRSNASAKSTTAVSQGNKGNVPEEDQQQEQEQKRAKKRSSEMDDDSNSSGSDSETSSTAFDQRQVAAVKNPANEAENLQEKAEAAAAVAVEDDVAQVDFANEFYVFLKN